ncbi:unnamed protein product [Mucor hiemalis]
MENNRFNNSNTPNRFFNTPSPVVFPTASPTPKLFSTPSKKLPEAKSWQGIESVPQSIYHNDDTTIIYDETGEFRHQNHNYNQYNCREKSATPAISPLSMMMESDTILDDEDISSYRFSEEDYLSSIMSSRPPSSLSVSPLRRRPASFSSPSPQLHISLLDKEEADDMDEPIVGRPFSPAPNEDPIIERPRRFSLGYSESSSVEKAVSATKFGGFGKNFMSRMKKAASGKPSMFK